LHYIIYYEEEKFEELLYSLAEGDGHLWLIDEVMTTIVFV